MLGKSNYFEDAILNWAKGSAMPTAPTGLYVGLFNGDPTDAGTGGTEVTTTVRTAGRVAATFGTVTVNAGADTIANTGAVDFGNAAAGATFTHFAVFDAASAGHILWSNALTGGTQTVSAGTDVSFAVGALVISED